MELANSVRDGLTPELNVRLATPEDAGAIQRLLRESPFAHVHVDWRLPGDWLGTPGFVVYSRPTRRSGVTGRLLPERPPITACLAIAADPPPAAWVRVAAADRAAGFSELEAMLGYLEQTELGDVDELAWFMTDEWPEGWLEAFGFSLATEVITFRKDDLDLPSLPDLPELTIREVEVGDLPALAVIEAAAFEPRWRHSPEGLRLALSQAMSFDVAEYEGMLAGFQFSTRGRYGAHLARMTIRPDLQGRGIGKLVLAEAIRGYRAVGLHHCTLNTPIDNAVSQRLYRGFGFELTGPTFPVWSRPWKRD